MQMSDTTRWWSVGVYLVLVIISTGLVLRAFWKDSALLWYFVLLGVVVAVGFAMVLLIGV